MTDAYAIKDSHGKIIDLGMDEADLKRQWHPSYPCVPVTVSEKGEADEPPMMDLGDYYGIQVGPFVYMQRKTIQTATDAPMEDYEKAILNLCAYLSRGQVCDHGQGLTDYCQPCGRVNGGG